MFYFEKKIFSWTERLFKKRSPSPPLCSLGSLMCRTVCRWNLVGFFRRALVFSDRSERYKREKWRYLENLCWTVLVRPSMHCCFYLLILPVCHVPELIWAFYWMSVGQESCSDFDQIWKPSNTVKYLCRY